MIVNVVKCVKVEMTNEEIETIQATRQILRNLMDTMRDNRCEWVECCEDYEESANYTIHQIDETDTIINCLTHIVEMY